MASLLAKSLQMDTAAAFDINEACAGWARSVMLSQDMLHSGQYRHILVVTNEAFVPGFSYGAGAFELKEAADLDWAFATYTIGSGATATILSSDGPRWDIRHFSDNRRAEDCLFPAQWPKPHEHSMGSVNSAGQGPDVFTCYGRKIQLASIRSISRFLKDQRETILSSNLFIPHTQTYRAYLDLLKLVQAERDSYSLFPQFVKIITRSLPASLAHARNHGYLKEGDSVFMLIPASGLSVFTLHFCDGGL
jgi:3-oxoacyl-[acyl-carrier-protein] synthase-3